MQAAQEGSRLSLPRQSFTRKLAPKSDLPAESKDAEETRRIVEACGRRCLLIPGNLTRRQFCDECIRRTVEEFGQLDILVSNAAYQDRVPQLEKVTDEEFDKTFKTNIYAYFYLCRSAIRYMRPGSAIIVTSSETGLEGAEKLLAYSSTKGAINAFTKALSMELAEKGIRVNAVAPGPVWTPPNTAARGSRRVKSRNSEARRCSSAPLNRKSWRHPTCF